MTCNTNDAHGSWRPCNLGGIGTGFFFLIDKEAVNDGLKRRGDFQGKYILYYIKKICLLNNNFLKEHKSENTYLWW